MMDIRPVWIDIDAGMDDIFSLMLALKLDEIDIKGISVVGSSREALEEGYRDVRNVLAYAGRKDIRVYKGACKPLVQEGSKDPEDCLGGLDLPDSDAEAEDETAWNALCDAARKLDRITIVTLGPLTNIATMIVLHPDVVDHIDEIVMMGGCIDGGNVTPCAEYNVYTDPEAAECIFKSGVKVDMFGLDVTRKTLLDENDLESLNRLESREGKLLAGLAKKHGLPMYLHDCCPVMYLAYPDVFTGRECGIYVETQGTITNGKTLADLYTDYKYEDRHCVAFIDMDRQAFMKHLLDKIG